MTFPEDFVWGAATAAFQIEGATRGRPRRVDLGPLRRHAGQGRQRRHRRPGREHYYRWREDLDLMRALGLQGYRFSIAWPRIQPDGRGPANQRGLDFYRRLVEGLLERGIEPLATLYHWDLPQALQDDGGWASRDIVERFAEYAGLVFDGLGDLVHDWITHNEPWVTVVPRLRARDEGAGRDDWPRAVRAAHHSLLAHGAVVRRSATGADGPDRDHARPDRRAAVRRRPTRPRRGAAARRQPQPLVPRPALPRPYPRRHARAVRGAARPARRDPGRRPRDDRAADRLPRRQLLPAEPRGRGRRRLRARARRGRAGRRRRRRWAGPSSPRR